jgi:uracil-DNA glycosylase family 4
MPKIIHSTGPVPCQYALIAERPGKVEAKIGRVLCGPSGEECDRYLLNNAGIPRHAIFCSNVVRDYRDDAPPSEDEIRRDTVELERELKAVQPQYILAMGLYSARWFLGPDVELEWCNGLVFPFVFPWNPIMQVYIMPVFHAAAGLHQPSIAAKVAWGFEQFGKLCHGEEMPTGHLLDLDTSPRYFDWTDNGIHPMGESKVKFELENHFGEVAIDTEGSVEHPWCLSASIEPGHAWVLRRHRAAEVQQYLGDATVVGHNLIHDLPVLAAMGVVPEKFTDTHLMAALLGVEPQGLKPLVRRHCGLRLREYDDVVREARRQKALEYLGTVLDWSIKP